MQSVNMWCASRSKQDNRVTSKGARRRAQSAAALICAEPCLSTFSTLLSRAGLVEDLESDGPFTIVSPTNAAFARAKHELHWLLDDELLIDVMEFHVLLGAFRPEPLRTQRIVRTLQGEATTLSGSRDRLTIGRARIHRSIPVANGTICIADGILSPQFGQPRGTRRALRWRRFATDELFVRAAPNV